MVQYEGSDCQLSRENVQPIGRSKTVEFWPLHQLLARTRQGKH